MELFDAHYPVQDVHRRADELPLPEEMVEPLDEPPELDDEPLVHLPLDPEEALPLEPLVHVERPLQVAESMIRDHDDRRLLAEHVQDPAHDPVQLLPVGLHDISFMPELMVQPVAAGEDDHVEIARDTLDEVLGRQPPLLQDLVDVLDQGPLVEILPVVHVYLVVDNRGVQVRPEGRRVAEGALLGGGEHPRHHEAVHLLRGVGGRNVHQPGPDAVPVQGVPERRLLPVAAVVGLDAVSLAP